MVQFNKKVGNARQAIYREQAIIVKEKWGEIYACFRQIFLSKNRDEWYEFLKDKDIPVGKVYSLDEVFTDPQVVYRNMVQEVPHPTLGKIKQVGDPLKLSKTPGTIRTTAPLRGQHTEEILQELGYPREDINRLEELGAIQGKRFKG